MSAEGSAMFVAADAYERHVGRYGAALARAHVEAAGIRAGDRVLDVGCGPGALTAALAELVGAGNVAAIDPSEPFVDACRKRVPGADVRVGSAEQLPDFPVPFDAVLSQLVVNFMTDAEAGVLAMRGAAKPGALVASCVWDYGEGMTLLRTYWDAALEVDPGAPDEARTMRWCTPEALRELWDRCGLTDIETRPLVVEAGYESFDDLWEPFTRGVGPAGAYCAALEPRRRESLRAACCRRLGSPTGPFVLRARAWFVRGRS